MSGRGFLEDKLDTPSTLRDTNHFVLSLIPYEETTTYKKGTCHGPEAIIEASAHIELPDETLRIDASSFGIETLRPQITDLRSIESHASELAARGDNTLLGFLGGEHSITPAIIQGLRKKDVGIIWVDAHADLRRMYHGREDNHACAGRNSVSFGRIVQIGIRSLAHEEIAYLSRSDRVQSFRYWAEQAKDAIRGLPGVVYLSIDLDGISPTLMRAVGTPEPGGLSWEEILELLDFVFAEKRVCAFDVVELCPGEEDVVSSFTAARLVYKIMAYHAHHKLVGKVSPSQ
ncbi:MAG: arginase family protein [Candidatus Krumholzibacteria bacterium]|nr:arginase family protein [Candidatus Krumholzibacteria bacterium]